MLLSGCFFMRQGGTSRTEASKGEASMIFSQVVTYIMALFFLLGAVDRLLGNRFGLGAEYEKAFSLMGSVALIIMGLYCISPVVAKAVAPVVVPAYRAIGADPAMFGPTFFTVDAGGYAMATQLADNQDIGVFAGIVVSTLIGAAISFTIPMAVSLISKDDIKYFAVGVMSGLIGTPVGCFFGGLACGLPAPVILKNLISVIAVAAVIIIGLLFAPGKTIWVFSIFAKLTAIIIAAGLVGAGVQATTGLIIIEGLNPLEDAAGLVGRIIVIVAGSLPLLHMLRIVLRRPIAGLAKKIGVKDEAILQMTISLAIVAPVFSMYGKLDTKGKILLAAMTATTANLIGGHLGFTAANVKHMIFPMFTGKIISGAVALILAGYFANRLFLKKEAGEK